MRSSSGVRVVAGLEAFKGGVVLLAGFGLLALVHHDVEAIAERLVEHTHLNPANRVPRIFLLAASKLSDARLWLLAAGAATYAVGRFVEAYGLWRRRRWAAWLAVVTGGIYVPFEIYELARGATWLKLATFMINAAIVAYMAYELSRARKCEATRG